MSAWVVVSKDQTPLSISNPWKVATITMIHWENGPCNCKEE